VVSPPLVLLAGGGASAAALPTLRPLVLLWPPWQARHRTDAKANVHCRTII
jgi:hypothetical protein